ncbi:MAG: lysylphosphatidylglycerol synthase transmembrane domain-containing protein [Thermoanaerobaculia bacterium]
MAIPARTGLALRLAVSAALVAWILRKTPFQAVGAAFRSADLRFVLLALALNLFDTLASVRRWRLLIRAQGGEAPFPGLVRAYFTGIFFNNLLPSTIGGDTVRVVHTSRSGVGRAKALAVIFVDRFLGLLALALFAIVGALASGRLTWMMAGAAALGLVAGLLFLHLKLQWRWDVLARASGWSLLLQTSVVLSFWCLARALHVPIPLPYFFLIVPLALFVMMLPVSINAIGVRENVWAFFFAAFGVPAALGVAVAWLSYGIVLVQALAGGAIYAWGRLPSSRLREAVP